MSRREEQRILALDPETLDEDDLDLAIGSALKIKRTIKDDEDSAKRVRNSLGQRKSAIQQKINELRRERRGR